MELKKGKSIDVKIELELNTKDEYVLGMSDEEIIKGLKEDMVDNFCDSFKKMKVEIRRN